MNFNDRESSQIDHLIQCLDQLKEELIDLRQRPEHQQFLALSQDFSHQWNSLQEQHKERKQTRDQIRAMYPERSPDLQRQSQQDGRDRQNFKQHRNQILEPLQTIVKALNDRIETIRKERQALALQLQRHLETIELPALVQDLVILYETKHLIVIDKPAGLLSVPGRGAQQQASVARYLQQTYSTIAPVHRLDQDTSGILIFAKDTPTQQQLQQQFAQRKVKKIYEACLEKKLTATDRVSGHINLPLWSDPTQRPYQFVNHDRGKSALTQFKVLKVSEARVELIPLTGRTHQLRVHMADAQGYNNPILGDRLYGTQHRNQSVNSIQRLYLHAKQCTIFDDGAWVNLISPTPF